jgi:hypothetical protein
VNVCSVLIRNKNYTYNYQNKQHKLDRENHIHNPNLYALWNLKSFISDKVARENPYGSSTFIYSDGNILSLSFLKLLRFCYFILIAGAWRIRVYEDWPDVDFVMNVSKLLQDKMLFGQLINEADVLKGSTFPDLDLIEGTFFMGSKNALKSFKEDFWKLHDQMFDEGKFVGKDQTLMNLYAFNISLKSVKLKIWKLSCNTTYNPWFFYQCYFANKTFYSCSNPKISLLSI